MKNYPSLGERELTELRYRFIRGYDKWYRMFCGHASDILSYRKGIIHLKIDIYKNFRFRDYALSSLAIDMVDSWRNLPELQQARGYHVDLYFSEGQAGVAISPKGKSPGDLFDALKKFLDAKPSEKRFLCTVKGLIDRRKTAGLERYLKKEYCCRVPGCAYIRARPAEEGWLDFECLCLRSERLHYANDFMILKKEWLLRFSDDGGLPEGINPSGIGLIRVAGKTHILHARLPGRDQRHVLGLAVFDGSDREQGKMARHEALKWALLQLRPICRDQDRVSSEHWLKEDGDELEQWCRENRIFLA